MSKRGKTSTTTKKRRLPSPRYKSFRLQKKLRHPEHKALPSAWVLWKSTFQTLRVNWKFFLGIAAIYGIGLLIFVRGFSGSIDVNEAKQTLNDLVGGEANGVLQSVAIFGALLGGSVVGENQVVSLYQTILVIIVSLAIIWGLRHMQTPTADKVSVKEAFYKGMQPLIPVLIILFVIGLQLTIASIAASIYNAVIVQGLAITGIEQAVWIVLVGLLLLLTLYLLTSSIFALLIATLPGMEPLQALRTARALVQHRRFLLMRKLLVLPILLLIFIGFFVIPAIALLPAIAEPLFFVFSVVTLPISLTYIYNLYRAML